MPGVDFRLLRERITMRDVLRSCSSNQPFGVETSGAARAQCMVRRIRGVVRFR